MNSKSKIDFDRLCSLRMLDMAEENEDTSWECSRMLEYHEDRGGNDSHHLHCLVEWSNINKTQSWVNFFEQSLINPIPIISFARSNNLIKSLEKIYLLKNVGAPECYLGGNVEFLGNSWNNQGLGLAISARTYI